MATNFVLHTNRHKSELSKEILIALGLSAGATVAIGFSRFAYALLLPPMREDLGWTYVQAGALNTANGIGYIVGALVAAWIAKNWGTARTFLAGFAISVLVLLFTATTSRFSVLFALRTVGGVSTAVTFILGTGLAAAICPTQSLRRRGTLVGLYVAGASIGILLAGAIIPIVLEDGGQHWPKGWLLLGLIGVVALPAVWLAARNVPEPIGNSFATLKFCELRRLAPTLSGYSLFGAGYVGYMTFIISLLQRQGGSSAQVILFWLVLGTVSAVSTLVWGRILGTFQDGRGPALVFVTTMAGALPVLLYTGPTAMLLSAVLFGGSLMAGPAAVTIVVQRQLPATSWTAAISALTVGFAFGQAVGPILAGSMSDVFGNISAGLWISPVLLGAAAAMCMLQRSKASSGE